MICLRIGKTTKAKTSPGDFKVTTPNNPLLSQQAITSKEILVPYTNLQWTFTPIPNWTCSIVTISYFQYTAPNTWLTTNLRRMLVAKFFSSSTRWRSRSFLVTRPYGVQMQQLLEEKDKLGQIVSGYNMLVKNLCIKLHSLALAVTTHKIIHIYV